MNFVDRIFRAKKFRYDYKGAGFAVKRRNLGFMDPRFEDAYQWSIYFEHEGQSSFWSNMDLRWRAHICLWAAQNALSLEGDLVECGVDTAMFAGVIVKYLGFEKVSRKFFLFDTFNGIPEIDGLTESEQKQCNFKNGHAYFDSYAFVKDKMKEYSNVHLVKGILPDTLSEIEGRKISYLSVDLNNAPSEKAVIERLWDQLTVGATVVIDDYGIRGFEPQYRIWNDFARSRNLMIATLPTGQGLLIKGHI